MHATTTQSVAPPARSVLLLDELDGFSAAGTPSICEPCDGNVPHTRDARFIAQAGAATGERWYGGPSGSCCSKFMDVELGRLQVSACHTPERSPCAKVTGGDEKGSVRRWGWVV